jgi:hypothetical protein
MEALPRPGQQQRVVGAGLGLVGEGGVPQLVQVPAAERGPPRRVGDVGVGQAAGVPVEQLSVGCRGDEMAARLTLARAGDGPGEHHARRPLTDIGDDAMSSLGELEQRIATAALVPVAEQIDQPPG